jgi:glucosamine-6-phosphate deaminase
MKIHISDHAKAMGSAAAADGGAAIREAIAQKGSANIIVATGASQFETLASLVAEPGIDWTRVTGFHLDEYIGLPAEHPASFRGYLKQRFVDRVPIGTFHYVNGETDSKAECERLGKLISGINIDVAFIGIGENGHLAFNDPPADFETQSPYLVVKLDHACRMQQLGEGWFDTLDSVPTHAISMSIHQIMKCTKIVCSVPDERKAIAVRDAIQAPVSPEKPATILQRHPDVSLYLDRPAAQLLV